MVFRTVTLDELDPAARSWVESHRQDQGLYIYRDPTGGGDLVLVAWGAKPTTGYAIKPVAAFSNLGVAYLHLRLEAPALGSVVAQVVTYPYALVRWEVGDGPVVATFEGARWQPTPPPAAGRPPVRIAAPAPGDRVRSPLAVRGEAQVFEGVFRLEVEDGHDVLARHVLQVAGAPAWAEFEALIPFAPPTNRNGAVIAVVDSARDGERQEVALVPVNFADAALPFADVVGHWALDLIARAYAAGYVSGYPDGSFRPDAPITRAEMLKLALAAAGVRPRPGSTLPPEWRPAADHWIARQGWLAAALDHAATTSSPPLPATMVVALDPDARATRLEAFGLALWAFDRLPKGETHGGATGENGATGDLPFRDASSLTAGERAVLEAAVRAGALTGYPDGTVRPTGPVTRAEALTILERLRGKQATGANSGSGGAGTAAGSGTS